MKNSNELNVTVIESTQAPAVHCQASGHRTTEDGAEQTYVASIETAPLDQFRIDVAKASGEGANVTLFLYASLPDRKKEDGLSFFAIVRHFDTFQSESMDEEGESNRPLGQLFNGGPDVFKIQLDGTVAVVNADGTKEQLGGYSDGTRCTLLTAGEFVFARVKDTYFAIVGVSEEQRQVIAAYNKLRGISTPAKLLRWAKKDAQVLAPALLGILAKAPNFQVDQDLHRALMLKDKPGVWLTNDNIGSRYHQGKGCTITYQPEEVAAWYEQKQEEALEALEQRFCQIKEEVTADVIDILFHHWQRFPNRKRDKATITLSQLCEYRGKKPEGDNLEYHWHAMRDARSIRLQSQGIDAALFDMDAAAAPQPTLWIDNTPPRQDVIYVYSPGFFMAEAVENNPVYLAPYLQEIWKLNPHQNSEAKRLARWLRAEWRKNTGPYIRQDKDSPQRRFHTWAHILENAGIDVEVWKHDKNPSRYIKAIERALATLQGIDYSGTIDDSIYEEPRLFHALPRKGLLPKWLSLRVSLPPSSTMKDALREVDKKRQGRAEQVAAQKQRALKSKPARRAIRGQRL